MTPCKSIPKHFYFILTLATLFVWALNVSANENGNPHGILLISEDALADAWKPFAEWKTKTGKPTSIVPLASIKESYKGKDIQEKIRACSLAHIEKKNVKWVILGGDSRPDSNGGIPDRNTPHLAIDRKHTGIPSDLYYISTTSWDANNDGVYGDWRKDMAAVSYTHPTACIGRIPLRTAADIKAYTEKVIAFESDTKRVGKGKMVYTCPEESAYPKLGTSVKTVSQQLNEHSIDEFYAIKTPFDKAQSGDHDLSVKNWVDMINANTYELMHMHGHGLLQNWILEKHEKVTLRDVKKLKNNMTPLFLTTVSCFTGEFDSKKDPCIAEAMLRQPAGGALVVVAPSREGRPIFHNPRVDFPLMMREGKMDATTTTMTQFWEFALESNRTVGEAFAKVKAGMIEDAKKSPGYHFVQVELNLLGDPSLNLHTAAQTD